MGNSIAALEEASLVKSLSEAELQALIRPIAHSVANLDILLSAATSSRTTASMQRRRSRRPLITRKRRRKFARAKPMLPRSPLSLQELPLYVLSPLLAPYLTPGMPTQGPLLI